MHGYWFVCVYDVLTILTLSRHSAMVHFHKHLEGNLYMYRGRGTSRGRRGTRRVRRGTSSGRRGTSMGRRGISRGRSGVSGAKPPPADQWDDEDEDTVGCNS